MPRSRLTRWRAGAVESKLAPEPLSPPLAPQPIPAIAPLNSVTAPTTNAITAMNDAMTAEPPYDMNGRGMPVIGMIPMVIPTFSKIWNMRNESTPTQISEPSMSRARASTGRPSPRPRPSTARTIVAVWPLELTDLMNEPSILILSNGNARKVDSDE